MATRCRLLIKRQGILGTNRFHVPSNIRCCSSKSMFENITNLDDAFDVFDRMILQRPLPSVVQFNQFLDVVTRMRYYSASLDFFNEMRAADVPVNEYTTSIVIKCYSRLHATDKCFTVLGFCFKKGIVPSVWTYNTILNGFILEDNTHKAEKLFNGSFIKNRLCEPNRATYNTMIKGLCKIGNQFAAIALLRLMDGRGCKPNVVAYNTIIDSLCVDIMIDDAFSLFIEMELFHIGISRNVDTYNSLLYALSMSGHWNEVCRMLKHMHDVRISPQVKTFNILIKALCKQGKMDEAKYVINIMVDIAHYHRNIVTYRSLIHGYCRSGRMDIAMETLAMMDDLEDFYPTLDIYNRLLDGFSKFDNMDFLSRSRDLDDMYNMAGWELVENSVTRYILDREQTCMLEDPSVGMEMWKQYPKDSNYMLSLKQDCDWYELDDALDLFYFMDGKLMNGRELNSDSFVYYKLIECASKCGRFDISRRLFHDLFVKGLGPKFDTYALMIRVLCERGLLKDAKILFLKMEKSGWQPRSIISDDIIQGYMENKPFDDVTMLFREIERRGYGNRVGECFKTIR